MSNFENVKHLLELAVSFRKDTEWSFKTLKNEALFIKSFEKKCDETFKKVNKNIYDLFYKARYEFSSSVEPIEYLKKYLDELYLIIKEIDSCYEFLVDVNENIEEDKFKLMSDFEETCDRVFFQDNRSYCKLIKLKNNLNTFYSFCIKEDLKVDDYECDDILLDKTLVLRPFNRYLSQSDYGIKDRIIFFIANLSRKGLIVNCESQQ